MRAYLIITGIAFGLLTGIHLWRFIQEGSQVADPFFIGITALAAFFCLWAFRLLRSTSRS